MSKWTYQRNGEVREIGRWLEVDAREKGKVLSRLKRHEKADYQEFLIFLPIVLRDAQVQSCLSLGSSKETMGYAWRGRGCEIPAGLLRRFLKITFRMSHNPFTRYTVFDANVGEVYRELPELWAELSFFFKKKAI